jgi:predicted house-cleaning noncanonical NTP pyrophosphatase (MazG superfamily)
MKIKTPRFIGSLTIAPVIIGWLIMSSGCSRQKDSQEVPKEETKPMTTTSTLAPSYSRCDISANSLLAMPLTTHAQVGFEIGYIGNEYPKFYEIFTVSVGSPQTPVTVKMDIEKWKQFIQFVHEMKDHELGQLLERTAQEIFRYYAVSQSYTLVGDNNFTKNLVKGLPPVMSPQEVRERTKKLLEINVKTGRALMIHIASDGDANQHLQDLLLKELPGCGVNSQILSELPLNLAVGDSRADCNLSNDLLCEAIGIYKNLKGLVCSRCRLLTRRLINALAENCPHLEALVLSYSCLDSTHDGKDTIRNEDVIRLSQKCPKMRSFSMLYCDSSVTDEAVTEGIAKNWKGIKYLGLAKVRITNDSIKALHQCKELLFFNIDHCLPPSPRVRGKDPITKEPVMVTLSDEFIKELCQNPDTDLSELAAGKEIPELATFKPLTLNAIAELIAKCPKLLLASFASSACDVGPTKVGEVLKACLKKQGLDVIGWGTPEDVKTEGNRQIHIATDDNGERVVKVLVIKKS